MTILFRSIFPIRKMGTKDTLYSDSAKNLAVATRPPLSPQQYMCCFTLLTPLGDGTKKRLSLAEKPPSGANDLIL